MAVTSSSNEFLTALLPEWQRQLQEWSASGRLTAAAQEALILPGESQALTDLVNQWASGDFTGIPPILLLSGTDMNGAMGAYAISTGAIYLNADWLATATKDQVEAVLTEELGHHLDGLLNSVDTPGDEGEYFAKFLSGELLIDAQKDSLRRQNDSTTITNTNSSIIAEGALVGNSSVTVNGAAMHIANDPTNKIQLLSVDNGNGSAWWNTPIDLSKDWSSSFYVTAFNGSGTSDGFTFAINGDSRGANAIGDGGQNLGFFGYDSKIGISNSYAVLLDMWTTQPASLIGFASSNISTIAQGSSSAPISLSNNDYVVSISYLASAKILSATVGGQTFSQDIDLQATVGNKAYLGFTAANGGGTMDTDVSNWDVTASEYITPPIIRSNSVYRIVDGPTWTQAQANAVNAGGSLLVVGEKAEGDFLVASYANPPLSDSDIIQGGRTIQFWMGITDRDAEGDWKTIDGVSLAYSNWGSGEPNNYNNEDYAAFLLYDNYNRDPGQWADIADVSDSRYAGLAEIPITSSITFSPTAKEGQTLTTTINLHAGTEASGNLVENATVYWKVEGITADDLESTSPDGLSGSGTIVDGKLVLNHALKIDSVIENENFQVSVYSDASMTAEVQIGTADSVVVQDAIPFVRGNSVYKILNGVSWTQAEANSVLEGGHLCRIDNISENNFRAPRKINKTLDSGVISFMIG